MSTSLSGGGAPSPISSLMAGRGVDPAQPESVASASNGMATASLVLGIVGLIIVPIVCSTLAIVFGAIGVNRNSNDPRVGGRGSAIAGLVLGIAGLALWIVLLAVIYGGSGEASY